MPTAKKLRQICQRVVANLMSEYQWALLDRDDFVQIVLERAKSTGDSTKATIARIAKNEYSQTLYATCSSTGNRDHRRTTQAFNELSHYLYRIARSRRPDHPQVAEEATQRALVKIYEALREGEINNPDTFLSGCIWKLRGALTQIERSQEIRGQAIYSWERDDWIERDEPAHPSIRPTERNAEREIRLRKEILDELGRKFEIHPRATRQLEAVLHKYLGDKEHEDIAEELNAPSVGAVSTLITRGKQKLAANEELEVLYDRWKD